MSLVEVATLGISDEELREFIVEAKKEGQGEYRRGQWSYSKTIRGYYSFSEIEVVTCKGKPVFQMDYQGHIMPDFLPYNIGEDEAMMKARRAFNFLKQVLLKVEPDRPFRGPEEQDVRVQGFPELQYVAKSQGENLGESKKKDLIHVLGTEFILLNQNRILTTLLEGGFLGCLIIGR